MPCPYNINYQLLAYRANGRSLEAINVSRVIFGLIIYVLQTPRTNCRGRERTRPVIAKVAFGTIIFALVVSTRCREKNAVAVGTFHFAAPHTVLGCISPSAVFYEFFPFAVGRHAPCIAPVGSGSVVGCFERGESIGWIVLGQFAVIIKIYLLPFI